MTRGTVRLALCVALLLLTAFVYARTAENGFIDLDDPEYVSRNPVVRQGLTWHGAVWALRSTEQANWHPLTWWSHLLDVSLFGVRPGPQHLVSALLHAISALLLYLALQNLTGARWPSALVAAIFAVHPVHVESVAWVAERKDVLCALFWMLALLAYSRHARAPSPARYLAVVLFFSLALLSKPMAVTLPLVLLLLDWWPLGKIRLREKLPLLALSLAFGAVTLFAQRSGGAVKSFTVFPLELRLENALLSTVAYPAKLLWPQSLGVFYPYPATPIPWWRWTLAAALIAALCVAAAALRRRSPWLAAGWVWYLVSIAPVLGLIQVGMQSMADRYAYLPSIGLTITLAWGAAALARRAALPRALAPAAAALVVFLLAMLARRQAGRWKDSETLFRHTLAVAGESSLIRANLGAALLDLGRWEDAARENESALLIDPADPVARFSVGIAYARLERWDKAAAAFRRVIEANPSDREARFNLGLIATKTGDRKTAEAQRDALRLMNGRDADNLGRAMAERGW